MWEMPSGENVMVAIADTVAGLFHKSAAVSDQQRTH